jgi:hypothetical protein
MIVKILILIGLVGLLRSTNKPFLCAGIYAVAGFLINLMYSPLREVLMASMIGFFLSWLYFFLLDKFENSVWWWIILLGGLAVGLV